MGTRPGSFVMGTPSPTSLTRQRRGKVHQPGCFSLGQVPAPTSLTRRRRGKGLLRWLVRLAKNGDAKMVTLYIKNSKRTQLELCCLSRAWISFPSLSLFFVLFVSFVVKNPG